MKKFVQETAACLVVESIESPETCEGLLRLDVPQGQEFYFGTPAMLTGAR